MKKTNHLKWILPLFFLAATSCYRAPEFPPEPSIRFNSLAFYDVAVQDSMVITLNFEDGDGDLGLEGNENLPPYHPFYFVTTDNRYVATPGISNLLGPRGTEAIDTMPPYNCADYRIGKIKNGIFYPRQSNDYGKIFPNPADNNNPLPADTFYIKPNVFAYNFLLDFMVKNGDTYEVFDWNEAVSTGCAETVNGKFPRLYDANEVGNPLSGELSYTVTTAGFVPYFRNDTLKLQIRIIDRARHFSNIIETPAFHFVQSGNRYNIEFLE